MTQIVDVLVDVNVFMWVSKKKILGGNYGLVALLSVTNSALSLAGEENQSTVGGGGGFADSFLSARHAGLASEASRHHGGLRLLCANRAI